jgi:hypothetical protein
MSLFWVSRGEHGDGGDLDFVRGVSGQLEDKRGVVSGLILLVQVFEGGEAILEAGLEIGSNGGEGGGVELDVECAGELEGAGLEGVVPREERRQVWLESRGGDGGVAGIEGAVVVFDAIDGGWKGPVLEEPEGFEAEVAGVLIVRTEGGEAIGLGGAADAEIGVEGAAEECSGGRGSLCQGRGEGGEGGGDGGVIVDGARGFVDDDGVGMVEEIGDVGAGLAAEGEERYERDTAVLKGGVGGEGFRYCAGGQGHDGGVAEVGLLWIELAGEGGEGGDGGAVADFGEGHGGVKAHSWAGVGKEGEGLLLAMIALSGDGESFDGLSANLRFFGGDEGIPVEGLEGRGVVAQELTEAPEAVDAGDNGYCGIGGDLVEGFLIVPGGQFELSAEAHALIGMGERAEAAKHLEEYVKLSPNASDASSMQAIIDSLK